MRPARLCNRQYSIGCSHCIPAAADLVHAYNLRHWSSSLQATPLCCPPSSTFLERPRTALSFSAVSESSLRADVEVASAAHRHEKYFLADGNVVFLVENTLYNVHRFFLQRDSPYFREVLAYHVGPGLESFPLHDPILLEDIRSLDFERFLGVFYPNDFGVPNATTVDEWTSILDLSVQWGFQSIRNLAIRELATLASPVDKIVLGRKYDIPEWLPAAYLAICQRSNALSLEEGLRLGLGEVINISEARQAIRKNRGFVPSQSVSSIMVKQFGIGVASAGTLGDELVSLSGSLYST